MTVAHDRSHPVRSQTVQLLSGVDTLVRLLAVRQELDERAGLNTATMVSGYPGSPLGTFDLSLDKLGDTLVKHRIVHRPGLNEELAAAVVWGSQMGEVIEYSEVDGVVGAWYGKGPGLDRSGDAIKHANAMGAGPNGGAVMFCGDDPSSKSSTLTCESSYTFADACLPVLYPGNQQDILDLGVHAYALSRYSGAWVGMKIVTSVADGIGSVDLELDRHEHHDPDDFVIDGKPWRHQPLKTIGAHAVPDQEALVVDRRLRAAQAYALRNGLNHVVGAPEHAPLGIVCAGKSYFDVVQAFADSGVTLDDLAGLGVRILKLGMIFPLVEQTLREFAESVDQLVVIEEKRPFIESQVRNILHEARSFVPVLGKRDADGEVLASSVGELDSTAIGKILVRVLPELASRRPAASALPSRDALPMLQLPARPPGFCSGCPHNRSTVFPDGALVGGGVGCHGIMYFEERHKGMRAMPPTPMGAEGVPWIGLSPFVSDPHLIQNLGDGTLSHSGSLAIRASVAAGVNITFKILFNEAVAMTGGQEVTGGMGVPAITRALEAEGVNRIVVCAEDPKRYGRKAQWARGVKVLGRDHLPEVQEELQGVPGVSVIIYDQQCAAEARRLRKRGLQATPERRIVINEGVCEGCGDCSRKSNCLSVLPVDTEFGEKRQIHQSSCNFDYTCIEGDCPSFVSIKPKRWGKRGGSAERAASERNRPILPSGTLRTPVSPTVERRYSIYFTGIGGTGVVTANRIIASAAESAGFVVGGVDQTGLSQKAGAVVSHLQIAVDQDAVGTATVSGEGADLYLSGDILQAAGSSHLAKVRPDHTLAVIGHELTRTAAMLTSGLAAPDVDTLTGAIADRVGTDRSTFINSQRIADGVFADDLKANIVLIGAAYQVGGLPMSLAQLTGAIDGLGRGAASNREAFDWGRWAVQDPSAVEAALEAAAGTASITDPSADALATAAGLVASAKLPGELRELLTRRTAQVIDFQSVRLGRRFLELPERAAAVDSAEQGWTLTEAVIESWFKLLTYKDEYEVARLHLKVNYDDVADELGIEGPYSVTYHLHPPILRRLGMDKKLPMGKPYELAFRALARMKGLRGTPFDVFGYDPDRKSERSVIVEYERLVKEFVGRPTETSYDLLVNIARSPMQIKGYASIKEDAVQVWHQQVHELRQQASESNRSLV